MKNEKHKALSALTCAAMSLPGMMSHAESPPEKTTASYRYSEYTESDLPGGVGLSPNPEPRYNISVNQFLVTTPVSGTNSLSVGVTNEIMTGASPFYVAYNPASNELIQVMSGATIEETRNDINASFSFFSDVSKLSIGGGISSENDYFSNSFSVSHSTLLNGKNTTLDVGGAISFDTITPTGGGSPEYSLRPVEENKQSISSSIGMSHVVNKTLLLGVSANYTSYTGYLSDPYKNASVEGQAVADSRPDVRQQFALNLQGRQYFVAANAALHADYRFFQTNWGTVSHTLTTAWYQSFGDWQVVPRLRYYTQTAANFYRNYYVTQREDGYYSSDYRLSEYQAISFRFKVSRKFDFATFHVSYESYDSGSGNSDLQRGENPGLVDFTYYTLGLDKTF